MYRSATTFLHPIGINLASGHPALPPFISISIYHPSLPHGQRIRSIRRLRQRNIPMLHNTSPIKLQHIHHSCRRTPVSILSKMDISRVVVEPRMDDCEIGGGNEARKATNTVFGPAR